MACCSGLKRSHHARSRSSAGLTRDQYALDKLTVADAVGVFVDDMPLEPAQQVREELGVDARNSLKELPVT